MPTSSVNLDKVLPPIATPEFHDRPFASSRPPMSAGNGAMYPRKASLPTSPLLDFNQLTRKSVDAVR